MLHKRKAVPKLCNLKVVNKHEIEFALFPKINNTPFKNRFNQFTLQSEYSLMSFKAQKPLIIMN